MVSVIMAPALGCICIDSDCSVPCLRLEGVPSVRGSMILSSWGNETSVDVVVAHSMHHGSYASVLCMPGTGERHEAQSQRLLQATNFAQFTPSRASVLKLWEFPKIRGLNVDPK